MSTQAQQRPPDWPTDQPYPAQIPDSNPQATGLGRWGPLIGTGIGFGTGAYMANRAQNAASQLSPEQLRAQKGAYGLADQAAGTAGQLIGESRPYIQQPANYYRTLLSGNRAAQQNVVGSATAGLNENYRGAQAGLQRSGLRGAAKDLASAGLNRQRVGQIGALTSGVQPAAADALGKLGVAGMQTGAQLFGPAGTLYSQLLNQGLDQRRFAETVGTNAGTAWGKFGTDIGNALSQYGKPGAAKAPAAKKGPAYSGPGSPTQAPPAPPSYPIPPALDPTLGSDWRPAADSIPTGGVSDFLPGDLPGYEAWPQ